MIAQFVKNVSLLIFINLLVKLLYVFGVEVEVQNTLGEEQYGLYFTLMNFVWLFQIITDFGLQNFNNTHIAAHPQLVRKYLPSILGFKAFLAVIFLVAVVLVGLLAGYWPEYAPFLMMIMLNQLLMSMILYLRSNLSALGYYRWDSWFSALDKFVLILLLAPFVVLSWDIEAFAKMDFDLLLFLQCQAISLGVTVLLLFLLILTKVKQIAWRWNGKMIRYIWRESRWYALIVFLMFAYTRLDAVMIEKLHSQGKAESGIYAASYRLLDVCNMLGFLFASYLIPMFASARKRVFELRKLWKFSFRLLAVIYAAGVCALLLSGKDLLPMLYDHATAYWLDVYQYLIPSSLAWVAVYTSGALLTSQEVLKPQIYLFMVGVALNVLLNLYLIPEYGAEGAAIATLSTQLLMAAGLQYLAARHLDHQYDESMLKRWIFFIGLIASLLFFQSRIDIPWMIKAMLSGLIIVVTGIGLQIISKDEWMDILRHRS